jgi:hypothetical protein
MKDILMDLARREEIEKNFIIFYEMFMKDEVACCLSPGNKKKFVSLLKILRDDSARHCALIRKIINKYDEDKTFLVKRVPFV